MPCWKLEFAVGTDDGVWLFRFRIDAKCKNLTFLLGFSFSESVRANYTWSLMWRHLSYKMLLIYRWRHSQCTEIARKKIQNESENCLKTDYRRLHGGDRWMKNVCNTDGAPLYLLRNIKMFTWVSQVLEHWTQRWKFSWIMIGSASTWIGNQLSAPCLPSISGGGSRLNGYRDVIR